MKKTFTKLPPEKQEFILNGFLQEFSRNDYENASISRVAKSLGIAKGSVYQYFGNKLALYQTLMAQAQEAKLSYIFNLKREDFPDFWTFYRQMFIEGCRFDLGKPLHSQLLWRTSQDNSNPVLTAFRKQAFQQGLDHFTVWIEQEQSAGLIKTDFEPGFIALTVVKQSQAIQEYLMNVIGFDPATSVTENDHVFASQEENILKYVDQSISMFRNSFSN